MAQVVRQRVAQQIVETIKDICQYDINFIDTKGVIFASTNASRIGNYHEIGMQVVKKGETIEVETDNEYFGTQKGVNIPFVYKGEILAVIGISGEPNEVRQYVYLAQKITSLILRENEIEAQSNSRKEQMNYIVRALTTGEQMNHNYFMKFIEGYHVNLSAEYNTILVKINSRYNPANLSFIENHIYQVFEQAGSPFITFQYPNEYIVLLENEKLKNVLPLFKNLAQGYQEILKVAVGCKALLTKQNESYKTAKLALKSLTTNKFSSQSDVQSKVINKIPFSKSNKMLSTNTINHGKIVNFAIFDELRLELLLGNVSVEAKTQFLQKTIEKLEDKEKHLLEVYFNCDLSLKETCEQLYIHKNTVQYQLDKIYKTCGLNPRVFQDAVILYLGLQLV